MPNGDEMTKAIVFDLDDTLLGRDKRIRIFNRGVLQNCIDSGISIILATSRPKRAVAKFLDLELLRNVSLITLNGAVFEIGGVVVQVSRIDSHVERVLAKVSLLPEVDCTVEYDGVTFWQATEMSDAELLSIQSATRDMLLPTSLRGSLPASKIAVSGRGRSLAHLIDEFEGDGIRVIAADNKTFMNIVAERVDKSTTLAMVAQELGIPLTEMISFGDDIPDIDMMKCTGKSVAMGNAIESVKLVATTVIGDCDTDAIGHYIVQHVLTGDPEYCHSTGNVAQ